VQEAQLGKTKVFLRKHAHDALEARRASARVAASTKIAAVARTFLCSSSLARRLKATRLASRVVRGFLGRRRARRLRRTVAATRLQSAVARGAVHAKKYARAKRGTLSMAALARGVAARSLVLVLRRERAAALLNRTVGRGLPRRRTFLACVRGLVRLETKARRLMAREALKRRRAELRDVGKLRQEKEAMKEEITRLKAQAAKGALEREAAAQKAKAEEMARLKEDMEREKLAAIQSQKDAELKARDELLAVKDRAASELESLREALERETKVRVKVEKDLVVVVAERDGVKSTAEALKQQLDKAQGDAKAAHADAQKAKAEAAAAAKLQKLQEQQHLSQQQKEAPAAMLSPKGVVERSSFDKDTAPRRLPSVEKDTPFFPTSPSAAAAAVEAAVAEKEELIAKLRQDLEAERHARANAETKLAAVPPTVAPPPPAQQPRHPTEQDKAPAPPSPDDAESSSSASPRHAETFGEKLRNGVSVAVWEAEVAAGEQVSLALEETGELTFTPRSRSLFRRTKPPAPVAVADVSAVRPGHSTLCGDEDEARFVTLVVEPSDGLRRDVVVQFHSDDARKDALAGLRHVLASGASREQRSLAQPPRSLSQPRAAPATPPADKKAAAPPTPQYDEAVAELEKQLLLERANNQKMMLQMLEMQNDVNRSSAKIVELKQESAGLRSQLVARDRMHADDARMRLQLGKRLQQLVFDNAALRRETVRPLPFSS